MSVFLTSYTLTNRALNFSIAAQQTKYSNYLIIVISLIILFLRTVERHITSETHKMDRKDVVNV
jgi:hypothetical protein